MGTEFWLWSLNGRDHSEDQDVDGRIILKVDFRKLSWEEMDWIHVAQDGDRWRAVANTIMSFRLV
jgi:hypothetical protein